MLDLLSDDKLLSPVDSAVIPLPHQIRAQRKVVSNPGKVRYLMADEVGLGKTIEAGLAIRELKLRGAGQARAGRATQRAHSAVDRRDA